MNQVKISFIFPIYKESKYLIENIKKILEDPYPSNKKEIIIAVDSPTEEFLNEILQLRHFTNVKLLISKERRGKVAATNEAAKISNGDILFFLDSDIELNYLNLNELVKEFEKADLIEFYKKIKRKNSLGKLLDIEYIIYYNIYLPAASKVGKSIALNGAGFAVKREVWKKLNGYRKVYVEDIDFAIRAFKEGYRYRLTKNVKVSIEPLKGWKQWFDQRKRWTFSLIEIALNHLKPIAKYAVEYPYLLILFFLTNPMVLFALITILLPTKLIYTLGYEIYAFILNYFSFLYLFLIPLSSIVNLISIIFIFLAYTLIILTIIEIATYIEENKIVNPIWIVLANLFYFPLYFLIAIYTVGYYIIFERPPKVNWKV